jgi:hypothetical protein
MENKNGFWFRTAIRAFVVLALVGHVSLTFAKGPAPVIAPAGKGFQIKYASDGTPLAVMSNTATGVKVVANAPLPISATMVVPVVITGAITGAQIAGPIGAVIGALGGLVLASTPALIEMAARAKLRVKADGSLEILDPNVCSVGPCFTYRYNTPLWNGGQLSTGEKPSRAAACAAVPAMKTLSFVTNPNTQGWTESNGRLIGDDCWSDTSDAHGASLGSHSIGVATQTAIPVSPVQYIPVTTQQAAAAIAQNAPTAAEVQALYDLNFPPQIPAPVVTGPARVFSGNTIELLSPSERRLTEEWKNLDYSTPGEVKVQTEKKITVTSDGATTTTTTVNSDGSTSTATTTRPPTTKVETVTDDQEADPKDPCKGFASRLGCADLDTPSGDIPKSSKTISYQEESVFGAGSCPANLTANIATLGHAVTVWDWQKTCALALPLRALVLALATFAALLIVMPGKVET